MPDSSPRRAAGSFDTSIPGLRHSADDSRTGRFQPLDTPERSARSSTSTPRSDPLLSPRRILPGSQDSTPSFRVGSSSANGSPKNALRRGPPLFRGFLLKQRKKRDPPASLTEAPQTANSTIQKKQTHHTWSSSRAESRHASLDLSGTPSNAASLPSSKGKERLSSPGSRPASAHMRNAFNPAPTNGFYQEDEPRRSTSIDAQRLVHMALSLSENRKMQLGSGHVRATSASVPRSSAGPKSSQANDKSGDIEGHLMHDRGGASTSQQPRTLPRDGPMSAGPLSEPDSSLPFSPYSDHQFHISPASRARAEKAQAYIGLAHDYLRLLDCLPPLMPGLSGPKLVNLSRSRPYNPLQYVRNRKVRNRERVPLDADAAGWNNAEAVRNWVDSVASASLEPNFVQGDIAMLPQWLVKTPDQSRAGDAAGHASVAQPPASKLKRKQLDWNIPRQDLFADAFWLEQGDHKSLIETRDGRKIFRTVLRPRDPAAENNHEPQGPKQSFEHVYAPGNQQALGSRNTVKSDTDSLDTDPYAATNREDRARKGRTAFLGRRRTHSASSSDSSAYEREELRRQRPWTRHGDTVENTAPLERHMTKLMKMDAQAADDSPVVESGRFDGPSGSTRRMGISKEPQKAPSKPRSAGKQRLPAMSPNRTLGRRRGTASNKTSTDDVAVFSGDEGSHAHEHHRMQSPSRLKQALGFGRRKHRDSGSRNPQTIAEQDLPEEFVSADEGVSKPTTAPNKATAADGKETRHNAEDAGQKQLFKGGRIGDAARKLMPLPSDRLLKDRTAWVDSVNSTRARGPSDASLKEGSRQDKDEPTQRHRRTVSELPKVEQKRSRSATDVNRRGREPQFYMPNLPMFTSSQQRSKVTSDQNQPRRGSLVRAKFTSKSPQPARAPAKPRERGQTRGGIKSADVSPNTSTVDLGHVLQSDGAMLPSAQDKVNDTFKWTKDGTGHRTRAESRGRDVSPRMKGPRKESQWDAKLHMPRSSSVAEQVQRGLYPCARDVAQARMLLESCGVKATAILARANALPKSTPATLGQAAQTTHQTIQSVAAKEVHVQAARMLSTHLENTIGAFEGAAKQFRSSTATQLLQRIDDLRDVAGSQLTMRVRASSDEADAFLAELTQSHTLAVKQVNDSIDEMMRSRRRRLRWLSRTVFSALEWLLVGIMWTIWSLVFCVRLVRIFFTVIWRTIKWLLFL